ncbi:carbohydrate ABC transporter permease [Kitasatospora herbaricolor]|uniref:carbohydrate ABC transporter permease n=1 Tax=Kitasatospora herbaricolor TaxID=68217 RepID=UPI0036D8CF6E
MAVNESPHSSHARPRLLPHRSPTRTRRSSRALAPLRVAVWAVVAANIALLIWVILTSLKDTREVFEHPWRLPTSPTLENFRNAWEVGNFGTATLNSVLVTLVSAALGVAIAAPAAYALSRPGSRAGRPLTLFFALGIGVPTQVIVLPVFLMLNQIGLTDSLPGLTLAYVGTSMPFAVFLLTAFFRSLPGELEEAAALDGAGTWTTFVRIMLPLARSGLVTAFVLQAIFTWNETMLALVLLQSTDKQTLPLALLGFVQQQQFTGTNWGGIFAGVCIVVLPMLALFSWLGRRITEGLTVGAGK